MSARDCPCAECIAQRNAPNALSAQPDAIPSLPEATIPEPVATLSPPSSPTDLLIMHLRAMCAVVRSLAGYLPYEQQLALWAAEEACRG